jgi:hypothetical protein
MPDFTPITLQRHQDLVSQKMGRCIIRLQLLESQLKQHLPMQQLEGSFETLTRAMEDRTCKFEGMTLGRLVGEFTSNYMRPTPAEGKASGDDPAPPGLEATFRITVTTYISQQDHDRITGQLRELVQLRNKLVHHFWGSFDLFGIPGCVAAVQYLDDAYQTISLHGKAIADFLKGMAEVRQQVGEYLGSSEAENLIDYGIPPDGKTSWIDTPIVHALNAALVIQGQDGWTSLADAVATIRTKDKKLTPKRYGMRSWRHLLNETKLFEVQKRVDAGEVRVWYRSRKF